MLKETIAKEALSLIFAIASNQLKKINLKLGADKQDIEKALNNHLRIVKNWSEEITFKDLKASKRISDIFIPLDLYVYPRRIKFEIEEASAKIRTGGPNDDEEDLSY